MKRWVLFPVLLFIFCAIASAQNPIKATLPNPQVNKDSWVMVEIWPEVRDITLSAYFLDFSFEKNKNLCEATKRVFDRDQEVRTKKDRKEYSSYRLCISITDAVLQGYIRAE